MWTHNLEIQEICRNENDPYSHSKIAEELKELWLIRMRYYLQMKQNKSIWDQTS